MENQAVRKSGKKKLSRSQRIRASGDVKAIADLNRERNRKRKVAKKALAAKVNEMTPEELKKWRKSKGVFVNPGPIDWEALAKEEEEKDTFQRERMKGRFVLGVVADAPHWDRRRYVLKPEVEMRRKEGETWRQFCVREEDEKVRRNVIDGDIEYNRLIAGWDFDKQWGVYLMLVEGGAGGDIIHEGATICEYSGRLVEREVGAELTEPYVFDLEGPDGPVSIDACDPRSHRVGRLICHSYGAANLEPVREYFSFEDRMPRVVFKARRSFKARGELIELKYDYKDRKSSDPFLHVKEKRH